MLACSLLLFASCTKKETVDVPVSKAIQGTFYLDVIETGEIQAIQSGYLLEVWQP
jgi:hypothetical protein